MSEIDPVDTNLAVCQAGAPASLRTRIRHRLAEEAREMARELTQATLLIWGVWTLVILACFLFRDAGAPGRVGELLSSLVLWLVLPPTLSFIGFVWLKRAFRSGK